jgi:hypothetical protein
VVIVLIINWKKEAETNLHDLQNYKNIFAGIHGQ